MKVILSYEEIREAVKHYLASKGLDLRDIAIEFQARECEGEYPVTVDNVVVEEVRPDPARSL